MKVRVGGMYWARGSLKIRLALASVVLILASIGLTVYFVLGEVGPATERIVLDAQEDDAQKIAAILSGRLVGLQLALRSAASQFPVDAPNDTARLREFIASKPVLRGLFSAVFIASLDGRMVLISDDEGIRDPHLSIGDREYFKDTLRYNRTLISRPTLSRVSGEPAIIFTFPVAARDGQIAAVLGASLRLSSRSLIGDVTRANSDRKSLILTIVTDSTGQIISHPSKVGCCAAANRNPTSRPRWRHGWRAGGRSKRPEFRSGPATIKWASRGVPGADWVVFRTARTEALLGGVMEGRKSARWFALGVALGGGALMLLTTFILLRPLCQLQSRALQLLTDEPDVERDWPRMSGELGELSHVFQHVIRQRQVTLVSSQLMLAKMRAVMAKAPVGIAFTRERRF